MTIFALVHRIGIYFYHTLLRVSELLAGTQKYFCCSEIVVVVLSTDKFSLKYVS